MLMIGQGPQDPFWVPWGQKSFQTIIRILLAFFIYFPCIMGLLLIFKINKYFEIFLVLFSNKYNICKKKLNCF